MDAPGIDAPEASVTTPEMRPEDWANIAAEHKNALTKSENRREFIEPFPWMC
jgi:hypothetical protein